MKIINKLQHRWKTFSYWQKGAILGGGFHLIALFLLSSAALYVAPREDQTGSWAPAIGWILFILYGLIEFVPSWIFYLITGTKYLSGPEKSWGWVLFLIYSTLFYALIGSTIAKGIKLVRSLENGIAYDKHDK